MLQNLVFIIILDSNNNNNNKALVPKFGLAMDPWQIRCYLTLSISVIGWILFCWDIILLGYPSFQAIILK